MPFCFKTAVGPGAPFSLDGTTTTNTSTGVTTFTPRTDYANCEFVVLSGADYAASASPFSMSVPDAQAIGTQIALVWAIAWSFRVLADMVSDHASNRPEGD